MAHDPKSPRSSIRLVAVDGVTLGSEREVRFQDVVGHHPVTGDVSDPHESEGVVREPLSGSVATDGRSSDLKRGRQVPVLQPLLLHECSKPHCVPRVVSEPRVRQSHIAGQDICAVTHVGKGARIGDHGDMIPKLKPAPSARRRHFLKEWREYRGFRRQEDLAERVSEILGNERFSRDRLSKFETHEEGIRESILYAISEALSIEPGWLFRDPRAVEEEQAILARLGNRTLEEVDAVISASEMLKRLP